MISQDVRGEINSKYCAKINRFTKVASLVLLVGSGLGVGGIMGSTVAMNFNPYRNEINASEKYGFWNRSVAEIGLGVSETGAVCVGGIMMVSLFYYNRVCRKRDEELKNFENK